MCMRTCYPLNRSHENVLQYLTKTLLMEPWDRVKQRIHFVSYIVEWNCMCMRTCYPLNRSHENVPHKNFIDRAVGQGQTKDPFRELLHACDNRRELEHMGCLYELIIIYLYLCSVIGEASGEFEGLVRLIIEISPTAKFNWTMRKCVTPHVTFRQD